MSNIFRSFTILRTKQRLSGKSIMQLSALALALMLPALPMHIVAENAVKHGICKKAGGGAVMIRTERHDNNIYITIEDSGVGFDPENLPDNGRTHAGIANVRSRLENMCHGRLEIESMIGSGTRVRIILPEYYN